MSDDSLFFTPATERVGLLQSRQLSPIELVTAVLARAERLQPVLNRFMERHHTLTNCASKPTHQTFSNQA